MRHLSFCLAVLLAGLAHAGDGRLLIGDAAEPIDRVVLGLQRTAVPIAYGVVVDTALLADAALALNAGLRYGQAFGATRLVVGARWVQFVGSGPYGSWVKNHASGITGFDASFSGPVVYGAAGVELGPVLLQAQARYQHFSSSSFTMLGGAVFEIAGGFGIAIEAGAELLTEVQFRGSIGARYQGEHFGVTVGAAYVHLNDPYLGEIPVTPALDLSWSF